MGRVPLTRAWPPAGEGSYEGTFSGQSPLYFGTPLNGNVAFRLVRTGIADDHLEIQGGSIVGNFLGVGAPVATFTAAIKGVLDCATRTMTGNLVDGQAALLAIGPIATPPSSFTGTIGASYDPSNAAFIGGHWDEQDPSGAGSGDWNASRRGP